MPMMSLISYSAGFATILAAAWSKTSFGITLLRIAEGWVRWVVWFIIISVNIVLGVSAIIMWTRCWPVAKLWNDQLEGTCWTPVTMERYQTFTSSRWRHGEDLRYENSLTLAVVYSGMMDIVLAVLPWKIIWHITINKREKFGALVAMSMGVLYASQSRPLSTPSYQLSSSGIIAFLKIISLKDISDSSCKSAVPYITRS